jgi:RNA polymerase sigma-70 factor (ECF subfamily)
MGDTDWRQIVALYDQLLSRTASPVVALHRAVAVAEVEGPAAGLALVDALEVRTHLLPAVRAELLRRLGRRDEARAAYDVAIARCENGAERAHLQRRRDELA